MFRNKSHEALIVSTSQEQVYTNPSGLYPISTHKLKVWLPIDKSCVGPTHRGLIDPPYHKHQQLLVVFV